MFSTSRLPIFAHEDSLLIPLSIAPVYGSSIRYAVSRSPPVRMLLSDRRQLQQNSGPISGKSSYTIPTLFEKGTARCTDDTTMPPYSDSRDL